MSKITYVITKDLVTGEPQINWCGSLLHLYEYKPLPKEGSLYVASLGITIPKSFIEKKEKKEKKLPTWKICLDFNIKDGKPCLHLRYEGIKLTVNDKLYFVDSSPFFEMTVIKKPHPYEGKVREVDFSLTEEDVKTLMQHRLNRIYIKYNNGGAPFDKSVEMTTSQYYKESEIGNSGLFKQILSAYYNALEDALVVINENSIEKEVKRQIKGRKKDEAEIIEFLIREKLQSKVNKEKPSALKVDFDYCYVYLMHDKRNGYHKIGMSNKPNVREKTLQSEVPAIEMVCSKKYPSRKIAKAIESALHNAYAEQRVRGEWFDLSPTDILMLQETLS